MKKLYLVRHTKATWKEKGVQDIDRPLKADRIGDTFLMANQLREKGIFPDHITCSPAIRAVHTATIFARVLEYPAQRILMDSKIYESNKETLLNIIMATKPEYDSLMIIGHNPTITNLTNLLTRSKIENMQTTEVACITFDIQNWEDVRSRKGKLELLKPAEKVVQ